MAILHIGTFTGIDDQQFEIDLDGQTFLLRLRWNWELECWLMDVSTPGADGTSVPLVHAIRLSPGERVTRAHKSIRGEFYVSGIENAGLNDLGNRGLELLFITEEELQ